MSAGRGRSRRFVRASLIVATAAAAGGPSAGATPVLTTLVTFTGGNGAMTYAGLTADAAGDLFGTTAYGGADNDGTVFELPAGGGPLVTVATFDGTNGSKPFAGVTVDPAGNLYGTTFGGNTAYKVPAGGGGTVVTLATFNTTSGGSSPVGGLILDAAGNLYGTAQSGGTGGHGTVFELPAGGGPAVTLDAFNASNGSSPLSGLTSDAAGNLYGTTFEGGPADEGTVFKVPASGGPVTTLAAFNGPNGAEPRDGVILDSAGNLYGTTFEQGPTGAGTVFKIPAGGGSVVTLGSFNGANGAFPSAGLIADAAGNLYGVAVTGGGSNDGTVFKVPAGGGSIVTLATFNGSNGSGPYCVLVADAAGDLFGTTEYAGAANDGTVFELSGTGFVPPAVVAGQTGHVFGRPATGVAVTPAAGLTIRAGGTIAVAPAPAATARQLVQVTGTGLTLAGTAGHWTATLDLGNNDLDLPAASPATVTDQVRQGYAGGTWAGPGGIVSRAAAADPTRLTALGVIGNDQGGSPVYTAANPFDGTTPGSSDVLVKYTYYGDANLDGVVNGADYARIDAGFLGKGTLTGWYNGDFNYDGTVDASDYTLIDDAFDLQRGSLSPTQPAWVVAVSTDEVSAAAVPEPAGLAAAAVLVGLAARRRRDGRRGLSRRTAASFPRPLADGG